MTKTLLGFGLALLMTGAATAQSYCPQVREAVATYGYEAAKRYALANYSKEAVKAAERCLHTRSIRRGATRS